MRTITVFTALALLAWAGSAPGQSMHDAFTPPAGLEPVWEDDRLNPLRAKGTARGEAMMARIWTDTVPRRLIEVPQVKAVTSGAEASEAPAKIYQELTGTYVQVGTFGDPATAGDVAAALNSAGIPSRRGVLRKGDAETPIVLAGPYASDAQAADSLTRLQTLGYAGAFVRRN